MGDRAECDPRPFLGRQLGATWIYKDAPYGQVMKVRHEYGDAYEIYTSEHTDQDALDDIWDALPAGLAYQGQERIGRWGDDATNTVVTYLTSHRRSLLIGINKTQFFATQGVR